MQQETLKGKRCIGPRSEPSVEPGVQDPGGYWTRGVLTCRASRRSNMLTGGRGTGTLSEEQANRRTACCSAWSGATCAGGPAGREALGGGLWRRAVISLDPEREDLEDVLKKARLKHHLHPTSGRWRTEHRWGSYSYTHVINVSLSSQ